jgi:hypothetical protein
MFANLITKVILSLVTVVSIELISGYPGVIARVSPTGSNAIVDAFASAGKQKKTTARQASARKAKLITPPTA